jgi:hypothetical protein
VPLGQRSPLKQVSGSGALTYELTEANAEFSAGHIATAGVFVLVGKTELSVVGDIRANDMVAIAKAVTG